MQEDVYIYILYSASKDRFYVGQSANPWLRLEFHNSEEKATYTSKGRPWELKATFRVNGNRSSATVIEKFIKKQKSRALVEKLIDFQFNPNGVFAQLVRVPHVRD
jgi:putative endonuclease